MCEDKHTHTQFTHGQTLTHTIDDYSYWYSAQYFTKIKNVRRSSFIQEFSGGKYSEHFINGAQDFTHLVFFSLSLTLSSAIFIQSFDRCWRFQTICNFSFYLFSFEWCVYYLARVYVTLYVDYFAQKIAKLEMVHRHGYIFIYVFLYSIYAMYGCACVCACVYATTVIAMASALTVSIEKRKKSTEIKAIAKTKIKTDTHSNQNHYETENESEQCEHKRANERLCLPEKQHA